MATLPIIQFTDEGIEKLQYVYFESGSESFIINYTHDEVLKLFKALISAPESNKIFTVFKLS